MSWRLAPFVLLCACGRLGFDGVPPPVDTPVSVLRGRVDITDERAAQVVVPSVPMDRSVLLFSVAVDFDTPDDTKFLGQLVAPDRLRFERSGIEGPASLEWQLVTWGGLHVQRGTVELVQDSVFVVLDPPIDVERAVVIVTSENDGVDFNDDDLVAAELVSPETLRLGLGDSTVQGNTMTIAWQVVEIDGANVQHGTSSLRDGQTALTVPTAPIDPARSWLVYSYSAEGDAPNVLGHRMVRGLVADDRTLAFDRSGNDGDLAISWSLVELGAGRVQRGSAELAPGTATTEISLAAVDPSRAFAFGGCFGGTGGRSEDLASDNPGSAWATATLAPTTLTLARGNAGAGADLPWSVIELR